MPDTTIPNTEELNNGENVYVAEEGDTAVIVDGGNGDDSITGCDGNDTLYGGRGDDILYGGDGDDKLLGEQGDDIIIGGEGSDDINGGKGYDIAIVAGSVSDYQVIIDQDSGIVTLIRTGADGSIETDTFENIERIQFADAIYDVNSGSFVDVSTSNFIPIANNDVGNAINAGDSVTIDVLANDHDSNPDDVLSITRSSSDHGTVDIVDGQLIFTADEDFFGDATINYEISDGNGGIATATVTVTVNDIPDIALDNLTIDEETSGAVVGTFTITDHDDSEHTITLSDDRFVLEADGSLHLVDGTLVDYESEPTIDLTITVTDSFGASTSETYTIDVRNFTEGAGQDGYIAGATITSENGIVIMTDASGNFLLPPEATGVLTMTGGVDIATGLPFDGVMKAPEGSTSITPLTTLIVGLMETGLSASEAEALVLSSIGVDAPVDENGDPISLSDYDPIAASLEGDATGDALFAAGSQVLNTVTMAGAVLESSDPSADGEADAYAALLTAMVDADADVDITFDISTSETIDMMYLAAGEDLTDPLVMAATSVITESNTAVDVALSDPEVNVLTSVTEVSIATQGDATTAIESSTDGTLGDFDLTTSIDDADAGDATGLSNISTDGSDIVISIDISSSSPVINITGDAVTLTVEDTATLSVTDVDGDAIDASGINTTLNNAGTIDGNIRSAGGTTVINNSGSIAGYLNSIDAVLDLDNSGSIMSNSLWNAAVTGGADSDVSNTGTIDATAGDGVVLTTGNVTNSGTIAAHNSPDYDWSAGVVLYRWGADDNSGIETGDIDLAVGLGTVTNTSEGVITSDYEAIQILGGGGSVDNAGTISGVRTGITISSGNTASGFADGVIASITNSGDITGGRYGVRYASSAMDARLTNSGNISAETDAVWTRSGLTLINTIDGVITGDSNGSGWGNAFYGVSMENWPLWEVDENGERVRDEFGNLVQATDEFGNLLYAIPDNHTLDDFIDTITNAGTINGNIFTGIGDDNIDNSGTINGDVDMGDGNDNLTNTSTLSINGNVQLGSGDDVINNSGAINGTIDGGDGSLTLDNSGTINTLDAWAVVALANSSVNNSGTIDAIGGDAIVLASGNITNSGILSGHNTEDYDASAGAVLYRYLDPTLTPESIDLAAGLGTVTNTVDGIITGDHAGVQLYGGGGHVINDGAISGGNRGVDINGGNIDGVTASVTNSGTITAGDRGVGLYNAGMMATLDNSGTITSGNFGVLATSNLDATNSGTIDAGSTAFGLFDESVSSVINNSGTITAGDFAVNASGAVTFTNSGTIETGDTTFLMGHGGLTLTNELGATITTDTDNNGSGVAVDAAALGWFWNEETQSYDVPEGVDFADHITNDGVINGNLQLGLGDDVVTNIAPADETDIVNGIINGNIQLDDGDDIINNSGAINGTNGYGSLDGTIVMGAGTNTLNNSGAILGMVDATYSSTDTINNSGSIIAEEISVLTGGGTVINDGSMSAGSATIDVTSWHTGGGDTLIINNGSVVATGTGGLIGANPNWSNAIFVEQGVGHTTVDNSGSISATGTAIFSMHGLTVTNQAGGVISGDSEGDGSGIAIWAQDDILRNWNGTFQLDGEGNTQTFTIAEDDTSYNDSVTNAGTMNGDVMLGIGDDAFTNAGGTVNGVVYGGSGNDSFVAGASIDNFDGGSGDDYVDYSASTDAVTVNLQTGVNTGGGAEGDTLISIENVFGSGFDDTITTSDDPHPLEGARYGIFAGGGNDTVHGGAFQDVIFGQAGDDTLNGGADYDVLFGGSGNDTLNGGSSWDDLIGGAGDDILNGGADSGWLEGGSGNDTFINGLLGYESEAGGAGVFVNLSADEHDDVLARSATDTYGDTDSLGAGVEDGHATQQNDVWYGSDAGSYVFLRAGDDEAHMGDGGDTLFGGSGNNILDGGLGIDQANFWDDGSEPAGSITQGISVNLADGTAINGWGGADTLISIEEIGGTHLDDTIIGDGGDNRLVGEDGNDHIEGGDGNDNLEGGAGDDTLLGGAGSDDIKTGQGNDIVDGGDGWDHLSFDSWQFSWPGDVYVDMSTGEAWTPDGYVQFQNIESINGGDGNDGLTGDEYDNNIWGDGGHDWIDGREGNDNIFGGDGDDILHGGDGDDYQVGGAGNDIFYMHINGHDTIEDFTIGEDRIDLTHMPFISSFEHLMSVMNDHGNGNMSFNMSDDTSLTLYNVTPDQLSAADFIFQDAAADMIIDGDEFDNGLWGDSGNDTINGYGGNDWLDAGAGNDLLYGGAGDDNIGGGQGDDLIDGGDGNDGADYGSWQFLNQFGGVIVNLSDTIYEEDGITVLFEGHTAIDPDGGTDTLVSIENIWGSSGDDILIGDSGNNGFGGNHGNDYIDAGDGDDGLNGDSGNDVLLGGAGNDWFNVGAGDDYVDGGEGWDHLDMYDYGGGRDDDGDGINEAAWTGVHVDLMSNEAWDGWGNWNQIFNIESVDGSMLDDSLFGDDLDNGFNGREGNDYIDGRGGNDSLGGAEGNDIIYGGDGDDGISGDAGDDMMFGGAGNDWFAVNSGNDTIDGGDDWDHVDFYDWNYANPAGVYVDLSVNYASTAEGELTITNVESINGTSFDDELYGDGNDNYISGEEGNDTLAGGGGNDHLVGGDGNDFFFVGEFIPDGNDYYEGGSGADYYMVFPNSGNDTIADFDPAEDIIDLRRVDGIEVDINGDVLATDVDGNAVFDLGNGNSLLVAGRTVAELLASGSIFLPVMGTDGADVMDLPDSDFRTFVSAGRGDDVINAGVSGSAEEFNPALYNRIYGGEGNDTINGGAGFDWISGGTGSDTLDGGAGWDLLRYSYHDEGVVADLNAGTVTSENGDIDLVSNFEEINGSQYDDDITVGGGANPDLMSIIAGDGNDTVNVISGTIEVSGGGGSDTISTAEGDDYIEGGDGGDYIHGGDGADDIRGDEGNDILAGGDGADLIDGGEGDDAVDYSTSGAAVNVNLETGVHSGGEAEGDTLISIENVYGSGFDDTITLANAPHPMEGVAYGAIGGDGNDTLLGGDSADVLIGQGGMDIMNGGGGNDYMRGGDGVDTFTGGEGHDRISYYWSPDGVQINLDTGVHTGGNAEGDIIATDVEEIDGSQNNDMLTGNADNQTFKGYTGDDVLNGMGGDDALFGNEGNDTFVYGLDNGNDIIFDFTAGAATEDAIDFSALGISDVNNDGFIDMNDLTIADDVDGNAVIDLGVVGTITLSGVTSGSLHNDDFIF